MNHIMVSLWPDIRYVSCTEAVKKDFQSILEVLFVVGFIDPS